MPVFQNLSLFESEQQNHTNFIIYSCDDTAFPTIKPNAPLPVVSLYMPCSLAPCITPLTTCHVTPNMSVVDTTAACVRVICHGMSTELCTTTLPKQSAATLTRPLFGFHTWCSDFQKEYHKVTICAPVMYSINEWTVYSAPGYCLNLC